MSLNVVLGLYAFNKLKNNRSNPITSLILNLFINKKSKINKLDKSHDKNF